MKNILKTVVGVFAVSGLFIAGCSQQETNKEVKQKPVVVNPGKVSVYVTAKDTDLRLDAVGEFSLQPAGQPLETQPFVLIDPAKQFQTIVGIGAALTDASAETFL